MDRVIKAYLNQFAKDFGYDYKNEAEQFELFTFCSILSRQLQTTETDWENYSIADDGNVGVDGFGLVVNGYPFFDKQDLQEYLAKYPRSNIEIVFIQSKRSEGFDSSEIGAFGESVVDFVSDEPRLPWTATAQEKINLFATLFDYIPKMIVKPKCVLYYMSLGNSNDIDGDVVINTKRENIIKELERFSIFDDIEFQVLGKNNLQKLIERQLISNEVVFEFSNKVALPETDNVSSAYIGFVPATEYLKLICDENDAFKSRVFYDNIRDFQGDVSVNQSIDSTLKTEDRKYFGILNNGITVIASKCCLVGNKVTLSDYQIINGCQTSNVIYQNRELIKQSESVLVPLRIIETQFEDLISKTIKSTNSQTAIKPQDLIAYSFFHKDLERCFNAHHDNNEVNLYYERRSKQYQNDNVEKKRIIDKTMLIKAMASFYFDKPHLATRYFGTIFKELEDKLFHKDHKCLDAYYFAACALYNLNCLFSMNQLDSKYQKIKYHLLMMARHEVVNEVSCLFRKEKEYVVLGKAFMDINEVHRILMRKVIPRLESIEPELIIGSELSKSAEFVTKILNSYRLDSQNAEG